MDYQTAKGWLRKEEREFLYSQARELPDNSYIVNIGVEFGASIVCFRQGAPNAEIIGIDLSMEKFRREYPNGGLGINQFVGDSWEWARQIPRWLNRTIDLLFIDGDHTHAGVVRDTTYTEYVTHGRLVIFHDCYDYDDPSLGVHRLVPGVNRAVSDWYDEKKEGWNELDSVGTMRVFRRV